MLGVVGVEGVVGSITSRRAMQVIKNSKSKSQQLLNHNSLSNALLNKPEKGTER